MPDIVIAFLVAAGSLACGWVGWELFTAYADRPRTIRGGAERRAQLAFLAAIVAVCGVLALLASGLERSELAFAATAMGFALAGFLALLAGHYGIDAEGTLIEAQNEIDAGQIRLEEARLQSLRAEDTAEKAKTQFLSNMSHEMRTPLAGALGAVELLTRHESTSADQQRYLAIIEKSTRSLLQLVDNVLDYNLADGQIARAPTAAFSLEAILEQARAVVELAAHEKGLELRLDIDGAIPQRLEGDAACVLRILLNLLDNAVKFTNEGSVVIRARFDDPPASVRYGTQLEIWVRLEVVDTGIGIGEQTEVILFEPLAQKDDSMTRAYGGAGMGLAVSRRLAHAMGGRLDVESRPGIGSTFSLIAPFLVDETAIEIPDEVVVESAVPADSDTVPADSGVPEIPDLSKRPRDERPTRQLLVVDDDPVSRMIAESQASSLGYEVDVVESGVDAIEALRRRAYAAVLMDCRMPGLDGYETTRRWRGQERDRRLPVIAVTAHAREGERERCLAAGMDEMLEKPVDTDLLAATLHRVATKPKTN